MFSAVFPFSAVIIIYLDKFTAEFTAAFAMKKKAGYRGKQCRAVETPVRCAFPNTIFALQFPLHM